MGERLAETLKLSYIPLYLPKKKNNEDNDTLNMVQAWIRIMWVYLSDSHLIQFIQPPSFVVMADSIHIYCDIMGWLRITESELAQHLVLFSQCSVEQYAQEQHSLNGGHVFHVTLNTVRILQKCFFFQRLAVMTVEAYNKQWTKVQDAPYL